MSQEVKHIICEPNKDIPWKLMSSSVSLSDSQVKDLVDIAIDKDKMFYEHVIEGISNYIDGN